MMDKRVFCTVLLATALAACSPGGGGVQPAQPAASSAGGGNTVVIVVTNTPTPEPQAPANVPIMPGATDLNVTQSDISYVIKSDLNSVMAYYEKEMLAKGWKEQDKPSVIGDFGRMYFSDPEHQVSMLLNYSPSLNQVVIRMSLITLNVVEDTATPKP
jgi:hypothetical protein